MLISVQGSLGGGAAPGAAGPRGREFPSGPAAAPRRAGDTGGPGRERQRGRSLERRRRLRAPGRPSAAGSAEPRAPSLRRQGKLRQAGEGCGLPPEPLSPAGQPGPGSFLGLCLPVQMFALAGRTLLPAHHPFPRHCQFRTAHGSFKHVHLCLPWSAFN